MRNSYRSAADAAKGREDRTARLYSAMFAVIVSR
jgi:hypothetical protein